MENIKHEEQLANDYAKMMSERGVSEPESVGDYFECFQTALCIISYCEFAKDDFFVMLENYGIDLKPIKQDIETLYLRLGDFRDEFRSALEKITNTQEFHENVNSNK